METPVVRRATPSFGWARGALAAGLLALVVWVHLARLDDVPRGLFIDESSIGWNAALIAESGRDEHGIRFPVYFEAFGEFKNPVSIYAAALVFRVVGVSVRNLRLASFLFFVALAGGVVALVRKLFPGSPATALYALAVTGLLPWFFTLSRTAFEVISQPAAVVWTLCLALEVYEGERRRPWLALALGVLAGLSLYTYSTARLLTPLFLLTLLLTYAPRRFWSRHLLVLAGAAAAAVPYVAFTLEHPMALVRRFHRLTFVFDGSLPLGAKVATFLGYYGSYWTPRYLLLEGDVSRRNSTGHAGQLYVVVFALAALGLVWAARQESRRRFVLLLALSLAASPVAAALTHGCSSLRSILLGLYLLIFSCFGFALLARISSPRRRRAALAVVALALAFESGRYLAHYFGPYAAESAWAFKSWDFRGALATAIEQRPRRIEVSARDNHPRVHLAFYRRTLPPHPEIEMRTALWPRAEPGVCVIYFRERTRILDGDRHPSRAWGLDNPTKLRCYGPPGGT